MALETKAMAQKQNIYVDYEYLCPVCSKRLSIEEVEQGVCKNEGIAFKDYFDALNQDFKIFERYFKEKSSLELRALQKLWAKRVLRHRSFSIEAPTGMGKTTFGIAMASFLWEHKQKKSFILVPTSTLVIQVVEKLKSWMNEQDIVYYHKNLKKQEKEQMLERIASFDYGVLVITSAFLTKHFDLLKGKVFDFGFVDDLDAVLKNSRNLDKILMLLGFSAYEIKNTFNNPKTKKGILVISTATAKQGRASLLFRNLLGFDVSVSKHTVRNVVDAYVYCDICKDKIYYYLTALGDGGLIFAQNAEKAQEIYDFLKSQDSNLRIGIVVSSEDKDFDKFLEGELDYLVGVATHYGKIVRGLDFPEKIKYALFYGVPGFKIGLEDIDKVSDKLLLMLINIFNQHPKIAENYYNYAIKPETAKPVLIEIFEKKEFEYASKSVVVEQDGIFIPDLKTYIQATGRTSRLYAGGITKGLSIVFDSQKYVDALIYKASFYDIDFVSAESLDLEKIKKELVESRARMQQAASQDLIVPVLFVVESPTKAKQISRFYGKPAVHIIDGHPFYEISTGKYVLIVSASLGHVVDLISKRYFYGVEVREQERVMREHYGSIKRCKDCGKQYVDIPPKNCSCKDKLDSKKTIEHLIEVAYDSGNVIIATDPDIEGEKISFDVQNFSKMFANVYRAEFHEVTKRAIDEALENLRAINEDLVKSQIVRRVEDRWIGYALTEILRKYFRQYNVSAGRVQTPVLGWVIDQYEKSKQKIKHYFVMVDNHYIDLFDETQLDEKTKQALKQYEAKPITLVIKKLDSKEEHRPPLPPYSTDEALKDINRLLKIPAKEAMQILQVLFENGLITYHRTDSHRVSTKGLQVAKTYLADRFVAHTYEKQGEGAHEAIRPTKPLDRKNLYGLLKEGELQVSDELTKKHLDVYDLIFKRFMASQTNGYDITLTKYVFEVYANNELIAKTEKEVIESIEGDAYELYPYIGRAQHYPEGEHKVELYFKYLPKALPYTEAEVIALMKEKAIGRPSTYATIISKLYQRGYVVSKKGRLIPTAKGIKAYNFLIRNYEKYVSEETTRRIEQIMDDISQGKANYLDVLFDLYYEIKEIRAVKATYK